VAEATQVPRQSRHVPLGAAEISVSLPDQRDFHIRLLSPDILIVKQPLICGTREVGENRGESK
jgi:hypothetical protein